MIHRHEFSHAYWDKKYSLALQQVYLRQAMLAYKLFITYALLWARVFSYFLSNFRNLNKVMQGQKFDKIGYMMHKTIWLFTKHKAIYHIQPMSFQLSSTLPHGTNVLLIRKKTGMAE